MEEKKVLMLEFYTDGSRDFTITVNPPKENLAQETVTEVMNTIIASDVFLTSGGHHLTDVKNCYYRTIITESLTSNQPGE